MSSDQDGSATSAAVAAHEAAAHAPSATAAPSSATAPAVAGEALAAARKSPASIGGAASTADAAPAKAAHRNPVKVVKDFVRAATRPKIPKMPESAQWECGESRTRLRNEFNTKEINAAALIEKYDNNTDKKLSREEVSKLLADFNGGMLVKPDELEFIMKIADANRDNSIDESEVLHAVRVWYASNKMPDSVARAMKRYKIQTGPLPSEATLKDFLETLNDSSPVKEAEVQYVRAVAAFLSGRENDASTQDFWRAVACWYLNIERGETDQKELFFDSMRSMHSKMSDLNVWRKFKQGERIDFTARGTLISVAIVVALLFGVPSLNMFIAEKNESSVLCESPHLSGALWWSGLTGLLAASLLVAVILASTLCPHCEMLSLSLWICLGLVSLIFIICFVIGSVSLTYCTSSRCGLVLWHWSHFVYIVCPIVFILFLCCGVPCMYCYMGSSEFLKKQAMDDDLRNRSGLLQDSKV
jgi:hypothetical protein